MIWLLWFQCKPHNTEAKFTCYNKIKFYSFVVVKQAFNILLIKKSTSDGDHLKSQYIGIKLSNCLWLQWSWHHRGGLVVKRSPRMISEFDPRKGIQSIKQVEVVTAPPPNAWQQCKCHGSSEMTIIKAWTVSQ